MSVRVMTWVWEHSQAEGLARLVLLAIADSADDTGANAWPSVATIASKCKVSERTVQRVVQALAASGQLVVDWNAGPHGTNRFRVVMTPTVSHPSGLDDTPTAGHAEADDLTTDPPTGSHPRQAVTGDSSVGGGVTAVSPEPSLRPLPPQPPAGGGRVCTRHRRPRSGCIDCETQRPTRPPWCGQCDKDTRMIEMGDKASRCKACHPLRREAS